MTVAKRMDPNKSEEAREAYELSLAGYSQRQIAEKMGHSQSWVRDRLKLHIENRVHPKADEFRAKQIDRAQIYIRSLWSQVLAGDTKAIAQAVRTEERIAKLLGLDSATAFKVEVEQVNDETEFMKMLNNYRTKLGQPTSDVPPKRHAIRARSAHPAIADTNAHLFDGSAAPLPESEFAGDNTFQPHEVQEHIQEPVEEFEPAPRPRRKKPTPNPSLQFLRDSDDD
ncbi:hypothetical protein [Streptomyces sp. NBC_00035]|uniref:hypothetical protein n=1 Tax=Streptomyces sp. NBC_00035 TaxID=2903614 RepID=UPI00324CC443